MNITDEALKAAQDTFTEVLVDLRLKEGGGFKVASQQRRAIAAALEAAGPHIVAPYIAALETERMRVELLLDLQRCTVTKVAPSH